MKRIQRRAGAVFGQRRSRSREELRRTVRETACTSVIERLEQRRLLATTGPGPVVFYEDFESPALANWTVDAQPGRISTVSDTAVPIRAGNTIGKFTLPAGEQRSELYLPPEVAGADRWYAFSTYVPADWVNDPYRDIVAQWHETPDWNLGETWRVPPLSLALINNQWQIASRWDSRPVNEGGWSPPAPFGGVKEYYTPFARGAWTDWVFHVDWSYGSDGLLEVWQNGSKIVSQAGPNTYNDQLGNYIKLGVYHPDYKLDTNPVTPLKTLYHDELRIGDASATLASMSPPPLPVDAFAPLKVNFQPANVPTVSGYLVDSGNSYGSQAGRTFGWTTSHTDAVYHCNLNVNQLLDTHVAVKAAARWELAVPNGKYTVTVGVGAASVASRNNVWIEGVNLINYQSLAANAFLSKSITVDVTDGKLTMGVGSAPTGTTRIDFIEVADASAPPPQSLVLTPSTLSVPEGSSASASVRLATAPAADVVVNVTKSAGGDADLTTGVSNLTFTPGNWSTPQSVSIAAAEDADASNGTASFIFSSTGIASQLLTATEQDNDVATPAEVTVRAAADAYVRDGSYASQNFGAATVLEVKNIGSNAGYVRESYLRFDLASVASADQISSAKLRFYGALADSNVASMSVGLYGVANTTWSESGINWSNRPATSASPLTSFTVAGTGKKWFELDVTGYLKQQKAAGASAVAFALKAPAVSNGRAAFESDEAGSHPQLLVTQQTVTPTQSLILTPAALTVPEGSAASTSVRLATAPADDVVVSVSKSTGGDADLTAEVSTLIFTPGNWSTPQSVSIAAAEDADASNGTASFIFSSTGIASQLLTATEQDNDVATPAEVTVRAAADAYVRDGSYASQNFGAATVLEVKNIGSNAGYVRESYLRFDLANVASADQISSATLRLYGSLADSNVPSMTVGLYGVANTTWSESGITWANRPAASVSPLATFTVIGTGKKWFELDVTGYLKQQKEAGASGVAFAIKAPAVTNGRAAFESDEAGNYPQLIVTQQAVTLAGLTLVNAATDQPVCAVVEGSVFDLDVTGTMLNFRAEPGQNVGSVAFELDGTRHVESFAPFSYPGDADGDYLPWAATLGGHTLTATPYSGPNATGVAGTPIVARFSIVPTAAALNQQLDAALLFATQQLNQTLTDFQGATTAWPQTTTSAGVWTSQPRQTWSSGFLPGALWQMYNQTADASWMQKATASTIGLTGNQTLTEDTEFRVFVPFAPLYEATGDTAYRQIILDAAAAKSTQFNENVGAFAATWRASTSGNPRANFGVLMDQMMDLELMFWAARQASNPTYYNQAVRNALTVAEHLVRPDGGSYHWGYFDKDTGQFISGETAQGYANDSTWSRGQAWGIYAFTMCYRETGDARFLATAKKMADFFIRNLPPDRIPYWDFDDPAIPAAYKDSSAAAIAASGLFELGTLDTGDGHQYTQFAKQMLGALTATPYLAVGTNKRSILDLGAWYVPAPVFSGQSGTIWGDYYLLEAINRYGSVPVTGQSLLQPVFATSSIATAELTGNWLSNKGQAVSPDQVG